MSISSVSLFMACLVMGFVASAQLLDDDEAQPVPETELDYITKGDLPKKTRELEAIKEKTFTVYREMSYRGLKVKAIGSSQQGAKNLWLRQVQPTAYRYLRGACKLGEGDGERRRPFHLPPELLGQPGLITRFNWFNPYSLTVEISEPARCYAYIWWTATNHDNDAESEWHLYHSDPSEEFSLYYRDLPTAGRHTFNFGPDPFVGAGFAPLAALRPAEQIIITGEIRDDKPFLHLINTTNQPRSLSWHYDVHDPGAGSILFSNDLQVALKPGEDRWEPIPLRNMRTGVMTFIRSTLKSGEASWEKVLAYGDFPVPAPDASITEPIIPFGGYIKLQVNEDAAIYGHFLAATFYHFRQMKMNAAVLGGSSRWDLEVARKYGIKCVIRMGNKGGKVAYTPHDVIYHPSVLTYMVGDEPHIGELDVYRQLYTELTAAYPEYSPVSASIFDSYGTGDDADPNLIYNLYLNDLSSIRFGRYYPFRKDRYGLLWPAEYKGMLPIQAVFQGLEANMSKPWWLAPPFFGKEPRLLKPETYWRIPTGTELAAFMHLALAHRCTGILGWGTHTHGDVVGVFFDGKTMARSPWWVGDEVGEFGKQLMIAKPILLNVISHRLPIYHRSPAEIDATAHWLKDGNLAVYVVNQDTAQPHAAELDLYLGAEQVVGNKVSGAAFYQEIAKAFDIYARQEIPFEMHTRPVPEAETSQVTCRLQVPELTPGHAALILITPKTRFTATPDEVNQTMDDGDYLKVDF